MKTPGAAGAMVVDAQAGVLYTHADEHLLLIDIRDIRRWEQPGLSLAKLRNEDKTIRKL